MTYILHIETATKVCSVAVSKDGECLALKESDGADYTHGEELTVFIQEVISSAKLNVNQLNAISISSGPGSYTGLRIGAACVKGLCYALNIPLIAIDSLECLAALKKNAGMNIAPVIDARRMEVYNAMFTSKLELLKATSADVVDEHSYAEFEPFVLIGDGAEKLQEIWRERNISFDLNCKSSALGQLELAKQKFLAKEFVDLAYWEPFYLKDFLIQKPKK